MAVVPVVDLGRRWAAMAGEAHEAAARAMTSGRLLLGEETAAFEEEFARFAGRRHAVTVASGTEALRLALVAMGVGTGHEVIVPALTAVPTVYAVCATGATPVVVDVDPGTAALDLDAAAAAVTARTRAVVPVHLYGRPAPIPDIGVPVVDDAAQAHGAVPSSPTVATAYSFYPTKNLGGIGDGGAVVTDDGDLAALVRLLRNHAREDGYVHRHVAGNSRLSEVEAAVLRVALAHLPAHNARRRSIAARYRAAAPHLAWPADHPDHVYHLCVVRSRDRERFRAALAFSTDVHYATAISAQPAYGRFAPRPCPQAEAWAAECVTLPCFPEMADDEVESVCEGLAR
ncbi:MAG: DegT/DnrJ/EryC1/StrS family aminotransferase [Actinomycetota bacterium]